MYSTSVYVRIEFEVGDPVKCEHQGYGYKAKVCCHFTSRTALGWLCIRRL